MTTLQDVNDFLGVKRLAVVGVSRQERDFSRALFREFVRRGYDAIPVNPKADQIEGRPCAARVQDIAPPVDAALLMTAPESIDAAVQDCATAGIKRVWIYRSRADAVRFCEASGIRVIDGHCPFMFWPDAALFHRLHGGLLKLTGRYPRKG